MPDIKPPAGAKAPPQAAPPKPAQAAVKDKDKGAEKKDQKTKKSSLNLKSMAQKPVHLFNRFQIPIIIVAVFALLAFTALRMLNYSNPPVDDLKVQENLSKSKSVRIDPKAVERIKALSESNVSTGTNVIDRDNPFEEN